MPLESLIELIRLDRLRPEHVARVVGFFVETLGRVAVENRPAKSDVLGGVAVAANRHVPTGEDELKIVAAGLAKNGDAVLLAESARVVGELLIDLGVPFGVVEILENRADKGTLIAGEKLVVYVVVGDVPVIGHAGAE